MIESYSFGRITVSGRTYTKDVIILPDGKIICPWRRKNGHTLTSSDISEIFKSKPDILVVGTGTPGMMKPDSNFISDLQAKGINVKILPTRQAVDIFNTLSEESNAAGACFHLTC